MDRTEIDFVTPSKNKSCQKKLENKSNSSSDSNENKKNRPPLPPQSKPSSLVLAPPTNPRDSMTFEEAIKYEIEHGRRKLDPNMDRKMLRRTISNRLSSHRSRVKKAQYVLEMEKMVEDLQETITNLTPQIESYKEKKKVLLVEHDSVEDELEQLTLETKLREMELKEKTLELNRLKELEKDANKYVYESKYDQNLSFTQFIQRSYPSLKFYEDGLHTFNAHDEVPNVSSSSEVDEEEIDDIDQYLNFDAMNFYPWI